jgi:hypothetical protein
MLDEQLNGEFLRQVLDHDDGAVVDPDAAIGQGPRQVILPVLLFVVVFRPDKIPVLLSIPHSQPV